jgi:hypothetical protein
MKVLFIINLFIFVWQNKNKNTMKKVLVLMCCVSLYSCGTIDVQGNPAAIQMGAVVGGAVGSVIGGNSDHYNGWALGNLIGTVAGAAIGNALTTPHNTQQSGNNKEYNNDTYSIGSSSDGVLHHESQQQEVINRLPLVIQNIRFVDANHNHAIEPREECKLVFDLYNEGNTALYNVFPRITLSNDRVGVSDPAIIEKMEAGQTLRYTATLYGYSNLRNGTVSITITACQQDGPVGDVHQFSLNTQQ